MIDGPLAGVSVSQPDRLYRWAVWKFWNVGKPYINFVALYPRGELDAALEEQIENWLARWEGYKPKAVWSCGGYVVTTIFPRIASTADDLRRMNAGGQDIVGKKGADALTVFASRSKMIIMMPGIDDALDLRDSHQSIMLNALTGVGVPVAVVDAETQQPRAWEGI